MAYPVQMTESTINVIISGVVGLFTGAIASLSAPWAQWGVEKRKLRLQARAKLLQEAREFISSNSYSSPDFIKYEPLYSQLLPYLSNNCKEKMKMMEVQAMTSGSLFGSHTIKIGLGDGRDSGLNKEHRGLLLDEIARLEKKWRLI
jgi:hypothetical protein